MNIRFFLFLPIILMSFVGVAQTVNDPSVLSKTPLTEAQLHGKSLEELTLLRNEIYARKGHVFKEERYQRYFETSKWYKPAASGNEIKLSEVETKNVNLLKSLEDNIRKKRDAAFRDLKKLKKALNEKDKVTLSAFLGKIESEYPDMYLSALSDLKNTLNLIDLGNVNWNKGRALYGVHIDNGISITEYKIHIQGDFIYIQYGNTGHSELFGGFDDGYSSYCSEEEFMFRWLFKMTGKGIVFCKFDAAG